MQRDERLTGDVAGAAMVYVGAMEALGVHERICENCKPEKRCLFAETLLTQASYAYDLLKKAVEAHWVYKKVKEASLGAQHIQT